MASNVLDTYSEDGLEKEQKFLLDKITFRNFFRIYFLQIWLFFRISRTSGDFLFSSSSEGIIL